jgi:hypothetical protein
MTIRALAYLVKNGGVFATQRQIGYCFTLGTTASAGQSSSNFSAGGRKPRQVDGSSAS